MTIPVEIERKFLVRGDEWRNAAEPPKRIRQGYLTPGSGPTVRVRRRDGSATLTIKGRSLGVGRAELEYEIPTHHADYLLSWCCDHPPVEKLRHRVPYGGRHWVVDVFLGDNQGLVLAEIELDRPDQEVALPIWLGDEVTDDPRYRNSQLYRAPFRHWGRPPRRSVVKSEVV